MGTPQRRDRGTSTMSTIDQLNYRSAALSMFGTQNLSSRKSSPIYGMGTGYHNQKQFISQDHEKCNFGRVGPGPAHYTQTNIWDKGRLGRLDDSTKVMPSSNGLRSL